MSTTVPTPTIPDDAVEAPVGRRPPPGIGVAGRLRRVLLPVLSLLVFLAAWQLAAASGVWNETFVPYPSTVWRAFLDASSTHDGVRGYQGYLLWEHLYMTLRRVLAGVVVGVAIGVVVGLLMGTVGWVRRVLEPWLTFLRALPPLAYFFLLVIWLGIDEAPKVTLLALAAFPPAAVATTAAVAAAPVPGDVGLGAGEELPSALCPRPRGDRAPVAGVAIQRPGWRSGITRWAARSGSASRSGRSAVDSAVGVDGGTAGSRQGRARTTTPRGCGAREEDRPAGGAVQRKALRRPGSDGVSDRARC